MSASPGWLCSNCQRQLRSALLKPTRLLAPRRTFVSLQEIANRENQGDLEDAAKDAGTRNNASRHLTDQKQQEPKSDVFLEKLFRSTGRKPPSSPFRLRYSQRLLRVGEQVQNNQRSRQPEDANAHGTRRRQAHVPKWEKHRIRGKKRREKTKDQFATREDFSQETVTDTNAGYSEILDQVLSDPFERSMSRATALDELTALKGQESLPLADENPAEENDFTAVPTGIDDHELREQLEKYIPKLKSRLKGAKNARDVRLVRSLWRQVQSRFQESNGISREEVSDAYTEIMSVFVEFNNYKLASQVWTAIQDQGFTPTLKQWSIMLELARKSGDTTSLKRIWRSMHEAGVLPDNIAWTSYLSALGRRSPYWMMESLTSLEDQWRAATDKGLNLLKGIDKGERWRYLPSIFPFNAALASLIHKKREDVLLRILSRIDSLKLPPNVDTFNTLLRRATTPGHEKSEVERILRQMKACNIEPDKITVTTLLDANLRDIGTNEDPLLVESSVKEVFAELDTHGIKPASHTYTTALNVLLNGETPNVTAARAVMKHMSGNGMEPTPHVYTILIGHYFNSEPPNRSAVDILFSRAKYREINVDSYFFDRLIEGYANIGDTDHMLECIRHLPKVGKAPGWIALRKALGLLSEVEYWENCEEIIRDVENQAGIGAQGIRSQAAGQPDFWELVDNLRLRGVVSPSTASEPSN